MKETHIVQRVDALKTLRSNVESIWNTVETLVMPLRIGNMYQRPQGEQMQTWSREDVYDSTAIWAAQNFAANIHGTVTNPAFKWFSVDFKKSKLNKNPTAKAWVQECNELMYETLYDGNFDPQISSAFQDLVGLGNCFFSSHPVSETKWKGINFTCHPIRECFYERDYRGNVYRMFFWWEWTATEIKSKWPNETLPKQVEDALKEGGSADKRFNIIYAIYFRPEKEANLGSLSVLGPLERPYGCKYVFKDDASMIGKEDGYYDMPVQHAPWEMTSGSLWGHGPGMVMAPTIEYINAWLEMQDVAVRADVDPAALVTERGLLSDLDRKPGAMTVVRDVEKSVKFLHPQGRVDLSRVSLEDLRKMVRDAFHENELQLKESPQMSATEAQIRYELMNRVLGPTMGRIQNSLLDPLLMRVFMLLWRNKQLPKIPQIVLDEQAQFKLTYSGPLMRAQRMDEATAMERFVGQLGAVAKVFPTVMNVFNPIEWARAEGERLGIPAKLMRTEAEVKALERQQQQVQAQLATAKIKQETGAGDQAMAEAKGAAQA